jgi:hypothetical protein
MTSLAELCLDLFLAGHAHLAAGEAGDGHGFERRIRDYLEAQALPHGSGFRIFGRRSVSGIYHQIDEQTDCTQALIAGEWKAHTGQIPKNDLLRFKAATDDYWLSPRTRRDKPVLRIFGGTGRITPSMRTYAAQWGIVLITPDRWPIPTLCDPDILWGPAGIDGPGPAALRTLRSLMRPLGQLLRPQPDGSWTTPPIPAAEDLAHRLHLWQDWSERAWQWWDDSAPARFDWLLTTRLSTPAAA